MRIVPDAGVDLDQPVGPLDGRLPEQHGIDRAEERRREADADGERPDGRHRERRLPGKLPDALPETASERVHERSFPSDMIVAIG